jgi:hypothetical protein
MCTASTATILLADLVLDGKGILEFAIIALGPAMGAGRGVDKLGSDADAVAGAANAALQHDVARAKFGRDLPHIDGLTLVPEARVAGDDEQFGEPRQLCDDVLGDALAEVFLIRVARRLTRRAASMAARLSLSRMTTPTARRKLLNKPANWSKATKCCSSAQWACADRADHRGDGPVDCPQSAPLSITSR